MHDLNELDDDEKERNIWREKKIDAVDDKYFINSIGRSQRVLSKKKQ